MSNLKTKAQFFKTLGDVVDLFPNYTLAQHLSHILRSKGDHDKPYQWTDEKLLKRAEQYNDELEKDYSEQTTE